MRITLLGLLGLIAVAALIVYVAYQLRRKSEDKNPRPSNPIGPPVKP